jgi:hypothetical protein
MNEDKLERRIPLTPAEQMLMIRNAVIGEGGEQSGAASLEKLTTYLQSADRMQQRLRDLESRAWVRETAFQSQAPVIARLIVAVRNLWNWMSTKWYVLPMLQQQNSFNVAAAQMIRELWTLNRSQLTTICLLQERAAALEAQIARLSAAPPADDR